MKTIRDPKTPPIIIPVESTNGGVGKEKERTSPKGLPHHSNMASMSPLHRERLNSLGGEIWRPPALDTAPLPIALLFDGR